MEEYDQAYAVEVQRQLFTDITSKLPNTPLLDAKSLPSLLSSEDGSDLPGLLSDEDGSDADKDLFDDLANLGPTHSAPYGPLEEAHGDANSWQPLPFVFPPAAVDNV